MILIRKIKTLKSIIIDFIYDIPLLFVRKKIFIVGYFNRKRGKITNNNWGDDINVYLFETISDYKIVPQNKSYLFKWFPLKNYAFIGSIICSSTNTMSRVWGTGLIDDVVNIKKMPSIFYSVRGPLTRQVLLKNGVDCPEKYGDPALLISRYYRPSVEKKYDLGLILHYVDEDNCIVKEFCMKHPDVLLIKMRGYSHWHDIPDQICSCKRVASTSLHGLIVSDSYQIPNLWIKLSDKINGGSFKYYDYLLSVNRHVEKPYYIRQILEMEFVYSRLDLFQKAEYIDYDSIYEACPLRDVFKKWNNDKY